MNLVNFFIQGWIRKIHWMDAIYTPSTVLFVSKEYFQFCHLAQITERVIPFETTYPTHLAIKISNYLILGVADVRFHEILVDVVPAHLRPLLLLRVDEFFADLLTKLRREALDGNVDAWCLHL